MGPVLSTFGGFRGMALGEPAADEFQHRGRHMKDGASDSCTLPGSKRAEIPQEGDLSVAADGSMQTTRLAARQRGEAQPERKQRRWRRRRRGWSRQRGAGRAGRAGSPAAQRCWLLLPAAKQSAEMQEQGRKGGETLGRWDEEGPEELPREY